MFLCHQEFRQKESQSEIQAMRVFARCHHLQLKISEHWWDLGGSFFEMNQLDNVER